MEVIGDNHVASADYGTPIRSLIFSLSASRWSWHPSSSREVRWLERHHVVLTRTVRECAFDVRDIDHSLSIASDPEHDNGPSDHDHERWRPELISGHDNAMEHTSELHMDVQCRSGVRTRDNGAYRMVGSRACVRCEYALLLPRGHVLRGKNWHVQPRNLPQWLDDGFCPSQHQ